MALGRLNSEKKPKRKPYFRSGGYNLIAHDCGQIPETTGSILRVTDMEISGKIIELLPEKSGKSQNGTWRKQEYILETDSQYSKMVCFMAWGDKIEEFAIKQGESLVVSVDLESREYNGRWYTDVKAWKISRNSIENQSQHHFQSNVGKPSDFPNHSDDDIPF